jgi:imidazolonepropionase-like amidohydrolase
MAMQQLVFVSTIVIGVATYSLRFSPFLAAQSSRPSGEFALVGATIYPSPAEEPIRKGVVLIRDGKIAAVGPRSSVQVSPDSQIIDCSGQSITAGFWNSHVHFFERKWANAAAIPAAELSRQLESMLTRYGFTSVFDLGSPWENTRRIRDRVDSSEVPGPRIRSTGEVLVAAGAVPSDAIMAALGYLAVRNSEIDDVSTVSAASRQLLSAGPDGLKVHLQRPAAPRPPFPLSGIKAVVDEAHRVSKPVFIHPTNGADVLAAVQAGVDVLAHTTPSSGPWDETTLTAMKDRGVAVTPTLTVWKELLRHDRISVQEQSVRTSVAQLRAWVGVGGTVLFGNDLGATGYDPGEEYALMVESGMSFPQILASLTTAPAERFGESARLGRVVPGFIADLVVVRGDPSNDIRALLAVHYTLRDGKIVYRAP